MGGACATLPGGRSFRVSVEVAASPCGASVTLMGGHWVVSHAVLREASEDVQGVYHGHALAPPLVVPCVYGEGGNGSSSESGGGGGFTKLEVVVNVPPANTTVNGTALQLRLAPLRNSRGWGARVWLGSAAIHEITEEE